MSIKKSILPFLALLLLLLLVSVSYTEGFAKAPPRTPKVTKTTFVYLAYKSVSNPNSKGISTVKFKQVNKNQFYYISFGKCNFSNFKKYKFKYYPLLGKLIILGENGKTITNN